MLLNIATAAAMNETDELFSKLSGIMPSHFYLRSEIRYLESPDRSVHPGAKMPVKVGHARYFHTFQQNPQHTQPHLQDWMVGQKPFQLHPPI